MQEIQFDPGQDTKVPHAAGNYWAHAPQLDCPCTLQSVWQNQREALSTMTKILCATAQIQHSQERERKKERTDNHPFQTLPKN